VSHEAGLRIGDGLAECHDLGGKGPHEVCPRELGVEAGVPGGEDVRGAVGGLDLGVLAVLDGQAETVLGCVWWLILCSFPVVVPTVNPKDSVIPRNS
jgi:hypothetical protein